MTPKAKSNMRQLTPQLEQQIRERVAKIKPRQAKPATKWHKGYLSRAARDEVLCLAAVQGKLEELIEQWTSLGRPKSMIGNAKRARYFAAQALNEYLAGVPEEIGLQVLQETQKYRIEVIRHA